MAVIIFGEQEIWPRRYNAFREKPHILIDNDKWIVLVASSSLNPLNAKAWAYVHNLNYKRNNLVSWWGYKHRHLS